MLNASNFSSVSISSISLYRLRRSTILSTVFMQIINYVKNNPSQCKMKQDKDKLSITFNGIRSVGQANNLLENILAKSEVTAS